MTRGTSDTWHDVSGSGGHRAAWHARSRQLPPGGKWWFFTIRSFRIAMENHPFLIGEPSINGPFSMAMLNIQRVYYGILYILGGIL